MKFADRNPYIKQVGRTMEVNGDIIDRIRMMVALKMSMDKEGVDVSWLLQAMLNESVMNEEENHEQAHPHR